MISFLITKKFFRQKLSIMYFIPEKLTQRLGSYEKRTKSLCLI